MAPKRKTPAPSVAQTSKHVEKKTRSEPTASTSSIAPNLKDDASNPQVKAAKTPTPTAPVVSELKDKSLGTSEDENEEEDEEEEDEDEEEVELTPKVQARLTFIETSLSRMTSRFLKDVSKSLRLYCGGTNAQMAGEMTARLEGRAKDGSDLVEEEMAVKRVHRECWGGCGSGESGEEEDY